LTLTRAVKKDQSDLPGPSGDDTDMDIDGGNSECVVPLANHSLGIISVADNGVVVAAAALLLFEPDMSLTLSRVGADKAPASMGFDSHAMGFLRGTPGSSGRAAKELMPPTTTAS
jgi:hypothetical protein